MAHWPEQDFFIYLLPLRMLSASPGQDIGHLTPVIRTHLGKRLILHDASGSYCAAVIGLSEEGVGQASAKSVKYLVSSYYNRRAWVFPLLSSNSVKPLVPIENPYHSSHNSQRLSTFSLCTHLNSFPLSTTIHKYAPSNLTCLTFRL